MPWVQRLGRGANWHLLWVLKEFSGKLWRSEVSSHFGLYPEHSEWYGIDTLEHSVCMIAGRGTIVCSVLSSLSWASSCLSRPCVVQGTARDLARICTRRKGLPLLACSLLGHSPLFCSSGSLGAVLWLYKLVRLWDFYQVLAAPPEVDWNLCLG